MKILDSTSLERPKANEHFLSVRKKMYDENNDITIIVQAYCNPEKTSRCISNILKYSGNNYRLLLLDNGTPDNSVLDVFEKVDYDNVEIIKVNKNITGVYAMSKIFHQIVSKYIAIVPNDVIVSHNWLENLKLCMDSDDRIGITVASSTNVSNFQFEDMGGFSDEKEMHIKAQSFNISNPKKWIEKIRIIPTATLYRREILDLAGIFDLGFIHDFGDDDFTFRVRRAGYKLMQCGDTFVHHDHDQTALPQERIDIMAQSRDYFIEKHHGIDAWEDTSNSINFALKSIRNLSNSINSVLAIDVKCGVPVLDIKNHCRANGIKLSYSKAYISDAKYLIDLQSVTDETICGDVERIITDEEKIYDYIIVGNPINTYSDPYKFIKRLSGLLKPEGYIIFDVRNTNGALSLLNMLEIDVNSDQLCPKAITYKDFIIQLSTLGYSSVDVTTMPLSMSEDLNNELKKLIISMDIKGDKEVVYRNIMTQDYWITANKKSIKIDI